MARLVFAVLALCAATAFARMAYQLPDGAEFILRARAVSETFSCENRPYGFYADVDNNCEIFHVCQPIYDGEGTLIEVAHFSFMCNNQTIFDQAHLACAAVEDAVPCEQAESFYDIANSEFGVIPDEK